MVDLSDIEAANRRGETKTRQGIWATAARYDLRVKRVMVTLGRGVELALVPSEIEGLQYATSDELSEIEISRKGFGLHFPRLDADVYLPALLNGLTGSKAWSAAMGQAGGQSRSEAKAEASRKKVVSAVVPSDRRSRPKTTASGFRISLRYGSKAIPAICAKVYAA